MRAKLNSHGIWASLDPGQLLAKGQLARDLPFLRSSQVATHQMKIITPQDTILQEAMILADRLDHEPSNFGLASQFVNIGPG